MVLRIDGVGAVCSRGVTVLLKMHYRLRREGRALVVTGPRPQVWEVFERLGVFQALPEWDPEGAARSP